VEPPTVIGGAVMAGVLNDRPEVRALVRHLFTDDWGDVRAAAGGAPVFPPRADMEVTQCVDPRASLATNAVRVRLCQDARAALASGNWRFDASDLMPTSIGWADLRRSGAFLSGMVDYVARGPGSLDGILADIEASWPEPS
jgi:hypothetical protein